MIAEREKIWSPWENYYHERKGSTWGTRVTRIYSEKDFKASIFKRLENKRNKIHKKSTGLNNKMNT